MWEGLQRGKEGGDVERGKKREVTEGIGMLQASNSSQNQGLSPSLALQDARSPRAEVGHDSPVPLHPFNSAGYLLPRILQGEVSGRAQEQMVSLVGPICQATLEQLVSAVLSRILFTFTSCQQGSDPEVQHQGLQRMSCIRALTHVFQSPCPQKSGCYANHCVSEDKSVWLYKNQLNEADFLLPKIR
ncbi:hypothetical protein Q9233_000446 [Columba guinea]|nr:hypothetical protein Q9233_000446 [Columba guinea]